MSSRHLPPISCRLPRAERALVVAFARRQGLSTSALIKLALRSYIGAEIGVDPTVNTGISTLVESSFQAPQRTGPLAVPLRVSGRLAPAIVPSPGGKFFHD